MWWFLENFEQVPTSRWEPAQKEALRNPYLALERLFGQLGRPVKQIESSRLLDTLPPGGILILDNNRRRNVDPARAERILRWVKSGGYLIVAAENFSDDPLLLKLGLSRYKAPTPQQCEAGETPPPKPGARNAPASIEFSLPGNDIRYRLRYPGKGLSSSTPKPAWSAADHDRNALLHYAWGRGQITVLDDLEFLGNRQIGNFDHAELIWALLRQYQPQGEIRLATRMTVPTLWQWLAESAWMVLISAALLIGVWLWRIIPRFGGTLAMPSVERRALVQHLDAIGRSVWREGGIAHWLAVVRQVFHKRLLLRRPDLYREDASQQRIALAKIAACTTKDVWSALTPSQAQTPDSFTLAMQILQRLDQRL
jgi:hypothetical protein